MTKDTSAGHDSDQSHNFSHPKYHANIDGLRAIAVLSVVGFHAYPSDIDGGFIGVDIFFVISGFLISTIVFENLEHNSFNFFEFYSRRIKRIFPALIVILIASFGIGSLILFTDELLQLARHISAGAGFISNYILWDESGYFGAEARLKPLLHLWSLGIEMQFYIIWPMLVWIAWKIRLNFLIITLLITAISFALNIFNINSDPIAAFYSPQTRFWELLIGSTIAYIRLFKPKILKRLTPWNGNPQAFIGMVLVVISIFLIRKESLFPGWWALLPTIGSALIISADSSAWINRVFLSNRLLVWFGLISYPLYLWHWMLLSYGFIENGGRRDAVICTAIVFTSIVFAWLTYEFIEKPIRCADQSKHFTKYLVFLMLIICILGVSSKKLIPESPYQDTALVKLSTIKGLENNVENLYGEKPCFKHLVKQTATMFVNNGCLEKKDPNRPSILLIGDSHSASLSLGLRPVLDKAKINFMQVSTGFCEPTSNDDKDKKCQDINNLVLENIASIKPDVVIINSHWWGASHPPYFNGDGDFMLFLINYLQKLQLLGAKKIFIVGQIPTWVQALPVFLINAYLRKNLTIPSRTFVGVQSSSLMMDDIMRSYKYPQGITYLSVKDILCDKLGCLTSIGPDLKKDLVVWDYGHLTQSASKFLVNKLFIESNLIQIN
jgi:peptidoglycan/LPS O-acetylase OafA/YrhL